MNSILDKDFYSENCELKNIPESTRWRLKIEICLFPTLLNQNAFILSVWTGFSLGWRSRPDWYEINQVFYNCSRQIWEIRKAFRSWICYRCVVRNKWRYVMQGWKDNKMSDSWTRRKLISRWSWRSIAMEVTINFIIVWVTLNLNPDYREKKENAWLKLMRKHKIACNALMWEFLQHWVNPFTRTSINNHYKSNTNWRIFSKYNHKKKL